PRRDADRQRPRRNVPDDHGSGADHGFVTDRYSTDDRDVRADPDPAADTDGAEGFLEVACIVVTGGRHDRTGAELSVRGDRDASVAVQLAVTVESGPIADIDAAGGARADVDRVLKQAPAADRDIGGIDDAGSGPEHGAGTGAPPQVSETERVPGDPEQP